MNDKTIADELLAFGNALNKVTAASVQRETFWNAHLQTKGEHMSDFKQAVARNKAADNLKADPKFYQGSTWLNQAATLIEKALPLLNTEKHPCEACGLNERENIEDWRVFLALEHLPEKLRKLSEHFKS